MAVSSLTFQCGKSSEHGKLCQNIGHVHCLNFPSLLAFLCLLLSVKAFFKNNWLFGCHWLTQDSVFFLFFLCHHPHITQINRIRFWKVELFHAVIYKSKAQWLRSSIPAWGTCVECGSSPRDPDWIRNVPVQTVAIIRGVHGEHVSVHKITPPPPSIAH